MCFKRWRRFSYRYWCILENNLKKS
jgi:hypothetical protein